MTTTAKGYFLSLILFAIFIVFWQVATYSPVHTVDGTYLLQEEYDQLSSLGLSQEDIIKLAEEGVPFEQMVAIANLGLTVADIEMAGGIRAFGFTTGVGGAAESASTGFPTPGAVGREILRQMSDPFYDKGPNDKGILLQLTYSLGRVAMGFGLAMLVAFPLGFLLGMSAVFRVALSPYIQILKPVSPLAWMPLALYTIKDAELSSIYFVWNEWNGLNLDSMIFAILVIGVVGLLLDSAIGAAMKFLSYKE
jgi:hypothetical protein